MSVYSLKFRTLAAPSGWNEAALITAYSQCLAPSIHAQMAVYGHIQKIPCPQTLSIHFILGGPLGKGVITHCTLTVMLLIECLHSEEISFMVLEGCTTEVIHARGCNNTRPLFPGPTERFFDGAMTVLKNVSNVHKFLLIPSGYLQK